MKKPLLFSLFAVLLLGLIAYFGLHRQEQRYAPATQGPTLPDFASKLAKADRFALNKGASTIHLSQQQGQWTLEESGNYPIALGELRHLLDKLGASKRLESRSSNAANYPDYGLNANASGFAAFAGDDELARIKIGSRMNQLESWYVLIGDNPQVWVVDGELAIDVAPHAWLEREVTDIKAAQLAAIELQDARLHSQQGTLVLAGLDGKTPNQPSINQLAGALAGLMLLDASAAKPELGKEKQLRYFTNNGLVISIQSGEDDAQQYWASFTASAEREQVTTPDNTADTVDSLYARAEEQSTVLNDRLHGYWLRVPSLTGSAFGYGRADLVIEPN